MWVPISKGLKHLITVLEGMGMYSGGFANGWIVQKGEVIKGRFCYNKVTPSSLPGLSPLLLKSHE